MPKSTGIVLDVAGQVGGPMPGVATLYDRSRWKNHGAFGAGAAAPTWTQLPSGVWGIVLDGIDSEISIPHSLSLTFLTSFSLEWWFYPLSLIPNASVWGKGAWANSGYYCQYFDTRSISMTVHTIAGGQKYVESQHGQVTLNTWHHIVAVKDGVTGYIYVNGAETPAYNVRDVLPATIDANLNSFIIGHYPGAASNFVNAIMVPRRAYPKALSPAQVRARFQATRGLFRV